MNLEKKTENGWLKRLLKMFRFNEINIEPMDVFSISPALTTTGVRPAMTKHPNTKLIPLTQGKFAIVDAGDYERLSKFKWHANKGRIIFYAVRKSYENGHRKPTYHRMHNVIIQPPRGFRVDHINHDGLDNRKSNLRFCTLVENQGNSRKLCKSSSIYKGVVWSKKAQKWMAYIKRDYKQKYLGLFISERDAALAYNKAALEYFGKFSFLNEVT